MINSMTGYGRAQETVGGREITAEVRSVNHRYFEVSVRVPRSYSYLEEKVKAYVQQGVSRGKLEVGLTIQSAGGSDSEIELNMDIAKGYAEAFGRMADQLALQNDAGAAAIARMPEVFNVRRVVPDEEQLWQDVSEVLAAAMARFCAMRAAEGKKLLADITSRLAAIRDRIGDIEQLSAPRLEKYREKLAARMQQVLETTGIDDSRILLEAALYADKTAVDEETVRLRSHLDQFDEVVKADEPVGRKLDFLVQEINREVNTIGSKAADYGITSIVVDIKADIEKIREQIQNIE